MRTTKPILSLMLFALVGCNSPEVVDSGAAALGGNTDKGDHGDDALTRLDHAVQILVDVAENGDTDLQRALARETAARIKAEDVWIGNFEQARGTDLWHMCMDFMPAECGDRPTDDDWRGTTAMREAIFAELDGYQWGNRLYFTLSEDTGPRELAATLVHEVNHVFNRSECNYYRDFDTHEVNETNAFVEEFRAFYSECWLKRGAKATVPVCRDHAVQTLEDLGYDMTPDFEEFMPGELNPLEQIAEELVTPFFWEDGSFGYLVPSLDHWPENFDPCD